jgi:hypothetical protein
METLDRLIRGGKVTGLSRPPGLKNLSSGIYLSMSSVEQGTSFEVNLHSG